MPFDGPDGYVAGLDALARLFEPRHALKPSEWAARYRWLVSKASAEPGRWKNERIPFLPAIMDALDPSHPAPIVVFCASSQVGKSECGLNWIGRTMMEAPGSILALFPTEKVARKWIRARLDSMIATTPELRLMVPLGRRSNSGNTLAEKHFPGGVLYTGSAGIPDDVASISVQYLMCDEVDRMPVVLEGEGDPIELAMRRLATYAGRWKAFFTSTPTRLETSRIWRFLSASTYDRYYVPCPHCNTLQALKWSGLNWIEGRTSSAVYVCEDCAATIEERAKPDLLAAGEWRATYPEREHLSKGFHVNGLYTPIGLGDSWANHAAAWERSSGKAAAVQVFFNTRLGEPHQGEEQRVDWEAVAARREPMPLRVVPRGYWILTSHTDVQADRVETQVLGWGRNERCVVVDYIVHWGDPTEGEVWDELDQYLTTQFPTAYGKVLGISCSLVDAAYLPDDVLGFTRSRKSRRIFAARGSEIRTRQAIGKPSHPDIKRRRKPDFDKRGAERYEIGVTVLKDWLFDRLRRDAGTPDEPCLPEQRRIRFPGGTTQDRSDGLPDEYFKQLTAESFDAKTGKYIGRANYHRNEALDTMVGGRAAAMHHSVAVHRYLPADWDALERQMEPHEGSSDVVSPEAAQAPQKLVPPVMPGGRMLPTAALTNKGPGSDDLR